MKLSGITSILGTVIAPSEELIDGVPNIIKLGYNSVLYTFNDGLNSQIKQISINGTIIDNETIKNQMLELLVK
jgi:hypothetical protein